MKPSVNKRWIVVGTAAALGLGAVGASAAVLNDRGPAEQTAAAVTLPPASAAGADVAQGTAGNGPADVADPSPESADSPNESAVDSADSPNASPEPAPQRALEVDDTADSPDDTDDTADSPDDTDDTADTADTASADTP